MLVLKTILLVILIIVAIILAIVIFILFFPFKYRIHLLYKNDERIDLKFKYIIFVVSGFFSYKPKIDFEFKLWNKTLIDNKKKKTKSDESEKKDKSIADTDFIENKELEKEVSDSKKAIKELFASAKKLEDKKRLEYEKSIDGEENKKSAFAFIDKFKNFFSEDNIYVFKKLASEAINAINVLKPKKCKVGIMYSDSEPYEMGMILALAAPLYAVLGDNLVVDKNSDSKFNDYNLDIIGYPRLYKLLPPLIRLYRDKKVKSVLFNIKNK